MKGMTQQQRGPLPPIPNGNAVNMTGYYPSQGQPVSNNVYNPSPAHGQNVNNTIYHPGSPSHGNVGSGGDHQMSPHHGMYINSSGQYQNAQSPDHMINIQHGAIYEQIHAVENQQTSKKKAPPSLPKRSPSTRLSSRSSSISSTSGLYEELPVDQYSDANGHVQYQQTQSPSGSHPSSPMMKHKVYTTQQSNSPSHQSKPFAYVSGATPPPIRKAGYPHNGSPVHSPGTAGDGVYGYNRQIRTKSEGAIFSESALSNPSSPKVMPKPPVVPEKSEIISRPKSSPTHAFQSPAPISFQPVQYTKPPPVASPPPPPHVYQQAPVMHSSPAMQRPNTAYDQNFNHPAYIQHTDTVSPASPKYQHRQLPPSPKSAHTDGNNSKKPIPPPPSFPAPPPPLPLQDRFLGAVQSRRSPSPPLPPPPSDFADKPGKPVPPPLSVTQGQTKYQHSGVGDVVPIAVKSPPPIPNTHQAHQLYNQPNSPPPPPPPSFMPPPPPPAPPIPNSQTGTSSFLPKKTSPTKGGNASHVKTDGQKIKSAIDNTELLAGIGKFQLKKAQSVDKPEVELQQNQVQGDETPQTSFLGVLRRAPGGVPINTAPADESSNPVRTTTSQEAVRDVQTVQYNTEEILPAPPVNFLPADVNYCDNRLGQQSFQTNQRIKTDQTDTGLLTDAFFENMDISDVDPREVPDLTVIPDDCPQWKRNMIEKKNRERMIEYKKKRDEEKKEQEKWKNIPDWKRKLIEGKQKEKIPDKNSEIELEMQINSELMVENEIPPPPEYDEEYLNSLPPWKRELLLKKKNPSSPGIMEA